MTPIFEMTMPPPLPPPSPPVAVLAPDAVLIFAAAAFVTIAVHRLRRWRREDVA